MKIFIIAGLSFIVFLLAGERSSVQSVNTNNSNTQKTSQEIPQSTPVLPEEEDLVNMRETPFAVQHCLPAVNVGEPFEFDLSINPFYLRIDLDGNGVVDYAMLIIGKKTTKRGLLICQNALKPIVLGGLAKSKTPLTDMESDNFIGSYWDTYTNKEARHMFSNHRDVEVRKVAQAKGEVLVFSYAIDGVSYIYWDGKAFRAAGE